MMNNVFALASNEILNDETIYYNGIAPKPEGIGTLQFIVYALFVLTALVLIVAGMLASKSKNAKSQKKVLTFALPSVLIIMFASLYLQFGFINKEVKSFAENIALESSENVVSALEEKFEFEVIDSEIFVVSKFPKSKFNPSAEGIYHISLKNYYLDVIDPKGDPKQIRLILNNNGDSFTFENIEPFDEKDSGGSYSFNERNVGDSDKPKKSDKSYY